MINQLQKIVALVDGSICPASVCDHAAWIASRTGAPVRKRVSSLAKVRNEPSSNRGKRSTDMIAII